MNNSLKKLSIIMLATIIFSGYQAQPASAASIDSMIMPFGVNDVWKVVSGYNNGYCHTNPSPCGGNEYYAFDLVPTTGDAGGKYIYSPVAGTVSSVFSLGTGKGTGVKITASDGYTIHLYHLMNVAVSNGRSVSMGTYIGQVYNAYSGSINHLHFQVTNSTGSSLQLRLSGRLYNNIGWTNQWVGQTLQNNAIYTNPTYSGSALRFGGVGNFPDLRNYNFSDVTSSVRVNSGCSITLYEHINYGGKTIRMTSNVSNLANYNFDNLASSLKISCP